LDDSAIVQESSFVCLSKISYLKMELHSLEITKKGDSSEVAHIHENAWNIQIMYLRMEVVQFDCLHGGDI
jgi:hypothetical protein